VTHVTRSLCMAELRSTWRVRDSPLRGQPRVGCPCTIRDDFRGIKLINLPVRQTSPCASRHSSGINNSPRVVWLVGRILQLSSRVRHLIENRLNSCNWPRPRGLDSGTAVLEGFARFRKNLPKIFLESKTSACFAIERLVPKNWHWSGRKSRFVARFCLCGNGRLRSSGRAKLDPSIVEIRWKSCGHNRLTVVARNG